jgi:hypothetical protein
LNNDYQENKMFSIIYIKMVKISSTRNFQYKLVKHLVLSILIPAVIILFSAWFFFGDSWGKSNATPTTLDATDAAPTNDTIKTESCTGMTKDKCNLDICSWDTAQNMCFDNK